MNNHCFGLMREHRSVAVYIISCVRSLRCPFYCNGHSRASKRGTATDMALTLFLFYKSFIINLLRELAGRTIPFMNKQRLFRLGLLVSALMAFSGTMRATDEVPCLVFTGHGSNEKRCLDLATFNRITFGHDYMTISSPKDAEPVTLLYSAFHHLEIHNDIPDNETGVESIGVNGAASLFYNAQANALRLTAEQGEVYTVGVFDVDGKLLLTGSMQGGESLSTETLSGGVYIAIAINGDTKLTLKFMK